MRGDHATSASLDGAVELSGYPAATSDVVALAGTVLATFDGLEEERFALPADFAIGRERRFDVGQNAAGDGNQVALSRQLQKFIQQWSDHVSYSRHHSAAAAGFARRKAG